MELWQYACLALAILATAGIAVAIGWFIDWLMSLDMRESQVTNEENHG